MAEPNATAAISAVPLIAVFVSMFGVNYGPYVLIFLGAVCGSFWAVLSAPTMSRWSSFWLAGRSILLSLLLTAAVTELLGAWFHWEVSELYIIVAIGIAALGDKWLEIIDTLKTSIQTALTNVVKKDDKT